MVADAITAYGYQTATDASFETISESVKQMGNARYNNGYSKGVTDADNRANANSVNYKTGYNSGYSAGVSAGTNAVQNPIISCRNKYLAIYLPYISGFSYSGSGSDGYFLDDGYKGIMGNGYYSVANFSGYSWISFGGSPQITIVPKGK